MLGDIIILHMCPIYDNHMMHGSWDIKCNRFLSSQTIFCLFIPLTTQNIKILKKCKKTWRHYHFTHMYHKWKSYDISFLGHGVWQTEFFVILNNFLHFYPPKKPEKSKFWKNESNSYIYLSFYTSAPKLMIICYTVPEIWCVTDIIIFHFGLFFALLPH